MHLVLGRESFANRQLCRVGLWLTRTFPSCSLPHWCPRRRRRRRSRTVRWASPFEVERRTCTSRQAAFQMCSGHRAPTPHRWVQPAATLRQAALSTALPPALGTALVRVEAAACPLACETRRTGANLACCCTCEMQRWRVQRWRVQRWRVQRSRQRWCVSVF